MATAPVSLTFTYSSAQQTGSAVAASSSATSSAPQPTAVSHNGNTLTVGGRVLTPQQSGEVKAALVAQYGGQTPEIRAVAAQIQAGTFANVDAATLTIPAAASNAPAKTPSEHESARASVLSAFDSAVSAATLLKEVETHISPSSDGAAASALSSVAAESHLSAVLA